MTDPRMNPRLIDNETLHTRIKKKVDEERKMTLEVLKDLKEIERRRLYLEKEYKSLFAYCTEYLGYCGASAQLRISAMGLLKELPELENKIQDGSLQLTTLSQVQTFINREEKAAQKEMPLDQKMEILEKVEGKSKIQTERELLALSSQPEVHLKERVKPKTPTLTEVNFFADEKTMALIDKIKGVLAHSHPNMTNTELVSMALQTLWEKIDPAREPQRKKRVRESGSIQPQGSIQAESKPEATPKTYAQTEKALHPDEMKSGSRYIAAHIKRYIWKRDDYRCVYIDPKTKKRCNSKHALQLDHYPIPFAQGGPSTPENLRLACASHNQMHAVHTYGLEKMQTNWRR